VKARRWTRPSRQPCCLRVDQLLRTLNLMVYLGESAGGAAELLVEPSVAGQLSVRLQRRTDGDSQSDVKLRHPVHRCGVQPLCCMHRHSAPACTFAMLSTWPTHPHDEPACTSEIELRSCAMQASSRPPPRRRPRTPSTSAPTTDPSCTSTTPSCAMIQVDSATRCLASAAGKRGENRICTISCDPRTCVSACQIEPKPSACMPSR